MESADDPGAAGTKAVTQEHMDTKRKLKSRQHKLNDIDALKHQFDALKQDTRTKKGSAANQMMEHHLKVDRGDPLSIGTAIHMMTAAVRSCKVNDRGFLHEDVHHTGTEVTYLSEKFTLSHFVAVLQIRLGDLEHFSDGVFQV